jgi:hypothetical protein
MTSVLEGVGGHNHAPTALPPGQTRYPLYRRLGMATGLVWTCPKNLATPGILFVHKYFIQTQQHTPNNYRSERCHISILPLSFQIHSFALSSSVRFLHFYLHQTSRFTLFQTHHPYVFVFRVGLAVAHQMYCSLLRLIVLTTL